MSFLLANLEWFATSTGEGAGKYKVTRRAAGSRSSGRWVIGAPSTLLVDAVVQPMDGYLELLPSGAKVSDYRLVHTEVELFATPGGPDVITVQGEAFAVYQADPFEMLGEYFWRSMASRVAVP